MLRTHARLLQILPEMAISAKILDKNLLQIMSDLYNSVENLHSSLTKILSDLMEYETS